MSKVFYEENSCSVLKCVHKKTTRYYKITSDDFLKFLGKGSFGIVYKGTDSSNQIVAIKIVDKDPDSDPARIRDEINIMETVTNIENVEHLLCLLDYAEDENKFYIVMPFYEGGTLTRAIKHDEIKSELECIEYFRQLCYGIMLLHTNSIMHRDLKTDNVLIKQKSSSAKYKYNKLYICDYGLSKFEEGNVKNTKYVGTCLTRAPEVLTGKYDDRCDIYSLGCVLYKMLTKKDVFDGDTTKDVEKNQKKETYKVKTGPFTDLSSLSLLLLEGCLQYSPETRITMDQLNKLLNIYCGVYPEWKPIDIGESIATSYVLNLKKFERFNIKLAVKYHAEKKSEPIAENEEEEEKEDNTKLKKIPKKVHKKSIDEVKMKEKKANLKHSLKEEIKEVEEEEESSKSKSFALIKDNLSKLETEFSDNKTKLKKMKEKYKKIKAELASKNSELKGEKASNKEWEKTISNIYDMFDSKEETKDDDNSNVDSIEDVSLSGGPYDKQVIMEEKFKKLANKIKKNNKIK